MKTPFYFFMLLFAFSCSKKLNNDNTIVFKNYDVINYFGKPTNGSYYIFQNEISGNKYKFDVTNAKRIYSESNYDPRYKLCEGNSFTYKFIDHYNDSVMCILNWYQITDSVVEIIMTSGSKPSLGFGAVYNVKDKYTYVNPYADPSSYPDEIDWLKLDTINNFGTIYKDIVCSETKNTINDKSTNIGGFFYFAKGVGLVRIRNGLEDGNNNLIEYKIK